MIPIVGLLSLPDGSGGSDRPPKEGSDSGGGAGSDGDAERENGDRTSEVVDVLLEEDLSKTEMTLRTGLTPEEIVLTLLTHFDGELSQDEFVDRLGWSTSSTSRLLSRMEDRGTIARVQLGRKKRIYLPERTPDTFRSHESPP